MPKLKTLTENQAFIIIRALDWSELESLYQHDIETLEEKPFEELTEEEKAELQYAKECLEDIAYIRSQLEGT